MSVGENVKERRIGKKLTQKELAIKVGVAESTICRVESGSIMPSILLAKALANVFECGLDDIVG